MTRLLGAIIVGIAIVSLWATTAFSDESPTPTPTPTPALTPTPTPVPTSESPEPSETPSPSPSVEIGDTAPQAKIEQYQTCKYYVRKVYERDSGLEPWVLTEVTRTPTTNDCDGIREPGEAAIEEGM